MRITTRFWLSAVWSVLIAVLIAGIALWSMAQLQRGYEGSLEHQISIIKDLKNVEIAFLRDVTTFDRLMMVRAADRDQAIKDHTAARERFTQLLSDLKLTGSSERTTELMSQFMAKVSTYYTETDAIQERLTKAGSQAMPQAAEATDKVWPALADVETLTAKLDDEVKLITGQAQQDARRLADRARQITLAAVGLLLIGTVLGVLRLRQVLVRPLLEMAAQIAEQGRSDDLSRRLQVACSGELAELVRHINGLLDSLEGIVGGVASATVRISATSQHLSGATQRVSQSMHETVMIVAQMSEGATDQARHVADVSHEADAMERVIGQAAAGAVKADQASGDARAAVYAWRGSLTQAEQSMQGLQVTVGQSVDAIERLNRLSSDINAIVDLIGGIATQTNLLALNAAIEAARAGEHGRGFAIVADEVRKLASECARSTGQISEMVRQIQAQTQEVVTVMGKGQSEATHGASVLAEAGTALARIGAAVEETDQFVAVMTAASRDCAEGLRSVAHNMQTISAVSEETASSAQQVVATATEQQVAIEAVNESAAALAEMAADMQRLIDGYHGTEAALQGRFQKAELVSAS